MIGQLYLRAHLTEEDKTNLLGITRDRAAYLQSVLLNVDQVPGRVQCAIEALRSQSPNLKHVVFRGRVRRNITHYRPAKPEVYDRALLDRALLDRRTLSPHAKALEGVNRGPRLLHSDYEVPDDSWLDALQKVDFVVSQLYEDIPIWSESTSFRIGSTHQEAYLLTGRT